MKKNIVRNIVNKGGISSLKKASKLFDIVIDSIYEELKQNKRVYVKGLGIFEVVQKKNRVIVFNAVNKKYVFPVYRRVKFTPSERVKRWLKHQ